MNVEKNVVATKRKLSIFVFVLNIVACFAVVILHTTLPVYSPWNSWRWVEMVALQAASIFAVPAFFMISGMNLLGYRDRYSTKVFFRKRLWKTGRAFILGSLFCYLIFCLFPHSFYGASSFQNTFGIFDFFKRFLGNQINDTYWFFYSIIYLYLIVPILSYIVNSKHTLQYTIVLLFAISIGIPFVERFGVGSVYFSWLFDWPFFSSVPLLYFCLGYYLNRYVPIFRYQMMTAILLYLFGTISMLVLGLWSNGYHKASGLNIHYDSYFVGMSSPFCVIQAVAIFLLFKSLERRLQNISQTTLRFLKAVSGATLGVYLFHILVIDWLGSNVSTQNTVMTHPLLRAVLVYVVTAVAVIVAKRCIVWVKHLALYRTDK